MVDGIQKKRVKQKVKQKIMKQFTNFKMIYSNISHAEAKLESLKRIIEEEKPAMVVIGETKFAEKEKIMMEGYEPRPMNRINMVVVSWC